MIDVKQAAAQASNYMRDIMNATDLTLEEVELSEDDRFWDITLSALVPAQQQPSSGLMRSAEISAFLANNNRRVYKRIRVDAQEGIVKSMKIRNIE